MNPHEQHDNLGRVFIGTFIAILVFAASSTASSTTRTALIAMGVLSVLIAVLFIVIIDMVKDRNQHAERVRAAEHNAHIQRKRADRLNEECRRAFNVHMSHLPVETIVQTLAGMGGGPIRIRDFDRESEWYRVATSPQFRHLFNQEDLRKLESGSTSAEDDFDEE